MRIWASSSTTRMRSFLSCPHLHPRRQRERERRTAAGRVLDPDVAVEQRDEPLADREPQAGAQPRVPIVHPVEGIEELFPRRRRARPVRGRSRAPPPGCSNGGRRPRSSPASPSPTAVAAFSKRLLRIRSRNTGSAATSAGLRRDPHVDVDVLCWRRSRSTDSATVSARSTVWGRARSEPASILDMSSRLAIRAFSRSVSPSIASSASRRSTAVVPGDVVEQVRDRRLDRGERAPEVVRDGGEQRPAHALGLPVDLGLRGGAQQPVALQDQRELIAERPEDAALRRRERRPVALQHDQPEHPTADGQREPLGRLLRRAGIPCRASPTPAAPRPSPAGPGRARPRSARRTTPPAS